MPLSIYKKLKLKLNECKLKFGGFIVEPVGKVVVMVENGSNIIKTEFVVIYMNIKSKKTINDILNLILWQK